MLFEAQSTKRPHYKRPLTWKSHVRLWEQAREVHEFNFQCDSCQRKDLLKDDQIVEKREGREPVAEASAIQRSRLRDALQRCCLNCGGPITNGVSAFILCWEWCHQEYTLTKGELTIQHTDQPQPKPSMRVFYAVHR